MADFFYGRNYFWTAWAHLFSLTCNDRGQMSRRDSGNNRFTIPLGPLQETNSILSIASRGKMTFGDLVLGVDSPLTSHEDSQLCQANQLGTLHWNTEQIIEFIKYSPSLETVAATRQMNNGCWEEQWTKIREADYTREIAFESIYTPSGQGLPGSPRSSILAQTWKNQLPHRYLNSIELI